MTDLPFRWNLARRERAERERLPAALAARPEMRHAWLRRLVLELRRG